MAEFIGAVIDILIPGSIIEAVISIVITGSIIAAVGSILKKAGYEKKDSG